MHRLQALCDGMSAQTVLHRLRRLTDGMEYRERLYRGQFATEGRESFCIKFLETDLWIGVDAGSYSSYMKDDAMQWVVELRRSMDACILADPEFKSSLLPYDAVAFAPETMKHMSAVSHRSGIGPMSAVAGAFAEYVAVKLREKYGCSEVIVENGGDIYADSQSDMDIAVFAGESPLSGRVGLHIPASDFPLGICTSSGTVGPSLSFGRADAVMIVCRDVMLADSYATAFANRIRTVEDLQPVTDLIAVHDDILAAITVKDDRMAMCGRYELRIFK